MKILMLSIFSPHFINWTGQLIESGHEIYWLDVLDSQTQVEQLSFVEHIVGWRYKWDYPGRYFVKNNYPKLNKLFNKLNERSLEEKLKKEIDRIKPDAIHCFVMFLTAVPVYEVIKRRQDIKWIYSAWGSDLYYHQNHPKYAEGIKKVLPLINYLFTDCERDKKIARRLGFRGEYLGKFPGGGGFVLPDLQKLPPFLERKIILVKGYQDELGECLNVLTALETLHTELQGFEIVIFGADQVVHEFAVSIKGSTTLDLQVLGRLPHNVLLSLMEKSLVYIGNSRSDGMPNTLLEAIVMGAFSIQSNPGGATGEIITHAKNGMLIDNPEDVQEIAGHIRTALQNKQFMQEAVEFNNLHVRPFLERDYIKEKVIKAYQQVEIQMQN